MTNILGFETRASVERQAREWLIRLDGDEPLTNSEIGALREWMSRSAFHRAELTRLSRLWKHANILTELAVPLQRRAAEREDPAGRGGWRAVTAASAVLASVVLAWWFLQPPSRAANGIYGTAIGQQQTIALPDGSSVQLNTDSQVQVTYSEHLRRLRLLRGEALFSVTHDPRRPFEVYAADDVVRAVGTAFVVRLKGSSIDVTVTKGVVDVAENQSVPAVASNRPTSHSSSASSLGRVKAGQMTTVGGSGAHLQVQELDAPELKRRTAWHEGYLVFSGEPLSEVIEQVNRYSPVTVEIADPELRSVAVGGRFRIGDLDAILDVLRTDFGIQSRQLDERNIRLESERRRR